MQNGPPHREGPAKISQFSGCPRSWLWLSRKSLEPPLGSSSHDACKASCWGKGEAISHPGVGRGGEEAGSSSPRSSSGERGGPGFPRVLQSLLLLGSGTSCDISWGSMPRKSSTDPGQPGPKARTTSINQCQLFQLPRRSQSGASVDPRAEMCSKSKKDCSWGHCLQFLDGLKASPQLEGSATGYPWGGPSMDVVRSDSKGTPKGSRPLSKC